jgi:hypothetical protein
MNPVGDLSMASQIQKPRQKFVYLSSKSRSAGSPNNAFYLLDCKIHCHRRPGEHITITPLFFSMMRGWDVVSASNRTFNLVIDGVVNECQMKIGSGYSATNFATMLQRVLSLIVSNFIVAYDRISNRFTFTPPDDRIYSFAFTHRHQTVFFGYPSDTKSTPLFSKTSPLTSPNNVSMAPQVAVVLRSNLPTTEVFDNFHKLNPVNTGILLVIPIDCPPYGELQYQCATPDTGTMRMITDHVHGIHLSLADETGDMIDCGDYVLGLRFDIYPPLSNSLGL